MTDELELTEREVGVIKWFCEKKPLDGWVPIVIKSIASKDRAEFWQGHDDALDIDGNPVCEACAKATGYSLDPRHTWTPAQWLENAKRGFEG